MFAYLDAESYADKFDGEYNLKGLIQTSIGYLFFNQLLYDQALLHIKEAREYFRLSHNLKNEVSLLRHIRDSFLLMEDNKQDSAFSYYHKSLDLANLSQNPTLQISVCLNLGVAYRESGEYKKAKDYLNQAIGLTEDNENQANLYFNLAQVFYSENKNDSTIYYLDKSIILLNENKDTYLTSSVYLFLSVLQEELGNGDVYVCDHFVYPEYKLGNIYSSSLI